MSEKSSYCYNRIPVRFAYFSALEPISPFLLDHSVNRRIDCWPVTASGWKVAPKRKMLNQVVCTTTLPDGSVVLFVVGFFRFFRTLEIWGQVEENLSHRIKSACLEVTANLCLTLCFKRSYYTKVMDR